MYDPEAILDWLTQHVQGVRRSRLKTLSFVVSAAMRMKGVGVLALGRAMAGPTGAKHCIKRVWRFFRNPRLETEALSGALLNQLAPSDGPILILADWTDLSPFQQLVFSLPRDGRSLPFWSKTVRKDAGEGSMVSAETEGLEALQRMLPAEREVILIADRGFGHTRWLRDIEKRGWGYVQRLRGSMTIDLPDFMGFLSEMDVEEGTPVRDWGWGWLTEEHPHRVRLVSVWSKGHKEPWRLATNRTFPAAEIVRFYQRRMWIEAMFRDLKNRSWGLGLDAVRLSEPERQDRHFIVLALAYAFLCAFGAAAETLEVDRLLKANTVNERVMNLARMGNYFLQLTQCTLEFAFQALHALPS